MKVIKSLRSLCWRPTSLWQRNWPTTATLLRRSHAAPDHRKLVVLGEFAESLGYNVRREPGRADLQKLLKEVQGTPHEYAISYAILRSMKQATYSPVDDIGHYAAR